MLVWRWVKNAGGTISYLCRKEVLSTEAKTILHRLRIDGIAMSSSLADRGLLAELTAESQKLFRDCWNPMTQQPIVEATDFKGDRSGMETIEQKRFLLNLTPKKLAATSIFLRYALQPVFLVLADSYLGQQARLRAVQLWLNYATEGEPTSTQLFHRDGDDVMNLKVFTYLSDVSERNGPFTFIPGSQPLGHRPINPIETKYHRVTDDVMMLSVPRDQWKVCTGKVGDVIFADTCGYHKGLKPTQGYRLMLMAHYASRCAVTGSDIVLEGSADGVLSRDQISALA